MRIGTVGCNYGRLVHVPAFRRDRRCEVVALAGTDPVRTAELARESGIALSFGSWRELVEHPDIEAVTIAAPPHLQPEIAIRALELGKPVFVEKPLAADLAGAKAMAAAALGRTAMIDFNFSAIAAMRRTKQLLDQGAVGRLRHVSVNWNVENYATRMRLRNWKSLGGTGGGILGNFVSHSFHYLEWFCGPITGLSARLTGLPDAVDLETNAAFQLQFGSGASGVLAVSCASYQGSGHRLEFYGEDGTLTLINQTPDYMRGFELNLAQRPGALARISVEDELDGEFPQDGRIAPVARLASSFLDAIAGNGAPIPGFTEGLRVQTLLDIARRANDDGRWREVARQTTEISA
ncbi:Gfo/Idh/MocA family protein [Rhodopseudomonas sp. B29]|uniref:Gfo/Idh/MocA family protein n=1 Tax=Rhodopseudomonas sp. B29 TaxID=95607 RepID=UPI0003B5444C|nr:Gfo/Idh/MocA family oxidoreductase [Rhodopseudomonas sp. B29]